MNMPIEVVRELLLYDLEIVRPGIYNKERIYHKVEEIPFVGNSRNVWRSIFWPRCGGERCGNRFA